MNADVLGTVLTGVGVLIGVWRIVTVQVGTYPILARGTTLSNWM